MTKLIECVPNFSEGRDAAVIRAISQSITSDPEIHLWDSGADPDHNRSVFTLAGTPEALERAVPRFVQCASRLIDMNEHVGVHPCIGATDVIPFIPLRETDMTECVRLAERVGERIARENEIPVYLYGRAARTPAHVRLADIRRGGYAKLKEEISRVPERFPDFGPRVLGPAGGTSIGAREILIAFNIFLDSDNLTAARQIARAVRESSGGIPGVQAIGLEVRHLAQVSMNILNYHSAPLALVYEQVRTLAARQSIGIAYSELIGMLPRAALDGTSAAALQLRDFSEDRILENRY